MTCSEVRLVANRKNAQLSSGPKTAEGKERPRRNSLKHGLSGGGIVVPEGDREEIERRVEALEADMKPRSPVGVMMIRQMAVLSVRAERAFDQESLAIAKRVRHAADDFDQERIDQADQLFDSLHENPRGNLRKLKKSPEGVDRLLDAWRDLRDDLTRDIRLYWTAAHLEQAANMTGVRIENARGTRIGALSRGVWGDFHALADRDGGGLGEEARQGWARAQLVERIDAEIAALEAHHETLDFDTIELDRLEAPGRALFDPSEEAAKARRHEAAAQRGFFKALKEFRQAEAESLAREEAAPSLPTPSKRARPEARMGSICETAPMPDLSPAWDYLDGPRAESSFALDPDGRPLTIGQPAKSPG